MARYVMRVRTDRPADEVFDFMADLTNFPEWDPGTKSAKQLKGDGPGVGAEYELKASGAKLHYVVKSYDRPQKIVARAQNRFVTSVDTITVTGDGSGCVVAYGADLTLKGPLKFGDPLLKRAFDRIGDKAAQGLTKTLDGTRLD